MLGDVEQARDVVQETFLKLCQQDRARLDGHLVEWLFTVCRLLAAQDFRDDTKDAGEIGAGHTVTALYKIIPPSKLPKTETPGTKSLTYQPNVPSPAGAPATDAAALRKYGPTTASAQAPLVAGNAKNELLTIWLRYKQPDADKSDAAIEKVLVDEGHSFAKASTDFRWAASVPSFGMIPRSNGIYTSPERTAEPPGCFAAFHIQC